MSPADVRLALGMLARGHSEATTAMALGVSRAVLHACLELWRALQQDTKERKRERMRAWQQRPEVDAVAEAVARLEAAGHAVIVDRLWGLAQLDGRAMSLAQLEAAARQFQEAA